MTIEKGQERDPNLEPLLVLMRHAARDASADGLSVEGERQAVALQGILAAKGIHGTLLVESSPKRRTRETLRPLSEATGHKVQVNIDLDERDSNESSDTFETRVKKFCDALDSWAQNPSRPNCRIACSHLDWLEAAVQFLSSDEGDLERSEPWPSMSQRVYRFQNGIWRRLK